MVDKVDEVSFGGQQTPNTLVLNRSWPSEAVASWIQQVAPRRLGNVRGQQAQARWCKRFCALKGSNLGWAVKLGVLATLWPVSRGF